ncbi:EF-P 5-aminopentanol modification-associated protein YfmF [Vagococcus xieshaowenii]|uniref:Insulinase family protein n=1 Tax=Vagococcus xieshaowenii TaxID=2562451 RepID=A0AAJ5EDI1_9ENTE|nr:pitrilysin family protein [Vagococcus xieshaowenii]QCA28073.1 insulinase family protein [Vagococcus xieshaowenii]TFZ40116.1 insulinase family protein [Vagococcus xieshaowenii]
MSKELAKNVNLHVIPTKKYKTIHVLIRFSTELTREKASLRTLLSSLLETNSLNYPQQTDISKKLSDMYGAKMGVGTSKKGNRHYMNAVFSMVNPKYLPNEDTLLAEGFTFMRDILFNPNAKEGQFDEETFHREKKNLIAYIQSIYDDKQSLAALNLQSLYFSEDDAQKTPGFGRAEDVETIGNTQLYNYYQQLLTEDEVDIVVLGDVQEEEIASLLTSYKFEDREPISVNPMYSRERQLTITDKVETLPVQQGKLNLAYQTDSYFHDEHYFTLQVFNGIFGGFAHSKLFMNVREKESMAYYASSSLDTFRGMMTVQTGIDSQNKEKVLTLVSEQLEAMRQGEISDEEMLQTKAMIRNQFILSQDNPSASMESLYLAKKFPQSAIDDEEWLTRLDAVTKEDVQQMAKQVELQAVYFMEGSVA